MAVHQLNLPVAEEVVKKAKTPSVESTKTQQSKFDQSLETTKTQPSPNVQAPQAPTKAQKANKAWEAKAPSQPNHASPTSHIQRVSLSRVNGSTKTETTFMRTAREIEHGQGQMEKILKEAMSGRKFDQQELLVLQAGVMRYAQELELASKVVEKATNGVKDTLKTQV